MKTPKPTSAAEQQFLDQILSLDVDAFLDYKGWTWWWSTEQSFDQGGYRQEWRIHARKQGTDLEICIADKERREKHIRQILESTKEH